MRGIKIVGKREAVFITNNDVSQLEIRPTQFEVECKTFQENNTDN